MSKEVAFETKAGVKEVGITLSGDRAVRVTEGKTYSTSDPEEIAALNAHENVKRASKSRKPRKRAQRAPSAAKSSTTTQEG